MFSCCLILGSLSAALDEEQPFCLGGLGLVSYLELPEIPAKSDGVVAKAESV